MKFDIHFESEPKDSHLITQIIDVFSKATIPGEIGVDVDGYVVTIEYDYEGIAAVLVHETWEKYPQCCVSKMYHNQLHRDSGIDRSLTGFINAIESFVTEHEKYKTQAIADTWKKNAERNEDVEETSLQVIDGGVYFKSDMC